MAPAVVNRGEPTAEVWGEAAAAFGLLASAARLRIVWVLAEGECDVSTLAARVGGTLPQVSQHLAKLKLAGLVRSRREGRRQVYLVADADIVEVARIMVGRLTDRRQGRQGRQGRPGARGKGA